MKLNNVVIVECNNLLCVDLIPSYKKIRVHVKGALILKLSFDNYYLCWSQAEYYNQGWQPIDAAVLIEISGLFILTMLERSAHEFWLSRHSNTASPIHTKLFQNINFTTLKALNLHIKPAHTVRC